MADVKISELTSLAQADVDANTFVLPIVNTTLNLTQKVTPNSLVKPIMASPGAIGSGTPSTGAFTTLSSTTLSTGTASATSISFGQDALNYYDEGTWTPTLTFSTPGDLSVAYSAQNGIYTRIGRQVTVSGQVAGTLTYTTASGIFYIDGLPFGANATQRYFIGSGTKAGFTAPNAGGIIVRTDPNNLPTGLYIEYQTTTSASPFTNTHATTGSSVTLIFTLTYFV